MRMTAAPQLRPFDLQIGDTVKYITGEEKKSDNPRVGLFGNKEYNMWVVTDISQFVFVCENKYKIKTAFQKTDYQRGKVIKID